MPRLYVDTPLAPGELQLPSGAARHAQVLRLQPGDALVLFDGRGGEWAANVTRMSRRDVTVQVGAHLPANRELAVAVTLAVVVPANERFEWLVEKATELGVHALQPLQGERSVLRLVGERAERRVAHWQAVAVAAAEQSGRTRVPVVGPWFGLPEWLARRVAGDGRLWLLDPQGGMGVAQVGAPGHERPQALTLLSGPEGGFSPAEVDLARRAGARSLHLGPRVLRADTAPLAALAALAAFIDPVAPPPPSPEPA